MDNIEYIDGYAVGHGTDIYALSLPQFCNFVMWMFTKNMDENETRRFKSRLWQPPAGETPTSNSPWSAENETAAFAAFKAQTQGG